MNDSDDKRQMGKKSLSPRRKDAKGEDGERFSSACAVEGVKQGAFYRIHGAC